jgi:hypothetical protein
LEVRQIEKVVNDGYHQANPKKNRIKMIL